MIKQIGAVLLLFVFSGGILKCEERQKGDGNEVEQILFLLRGDSYVEVVKGYIKAVSHEKRLSPSEKRRVESALYKLLDDKRVAPETKDPEKDVIFSPVNVIAADALAKYSDYPERRIQSPQSILEFKKWYKKKRDSSSDGKRMGTN